MRIIKRSVNPYQLDIDETGMKALTRKNVEFIEAVLTIDSTYRNAEKGASGSAKELFGTIGITNNPEDLKKQIKAIDQENSTHLSVSGLTRGSDQGIDITTKHISQIADLKDRLNRSDYSLVPDISKAISNRNNFSFASKFCTYACRYASNSTNLDGYCIYDNVISDVLPYYAKRYLNERHYKTKLSTIDEEFKDKGEYQGYVDLIDRIICAAAKETGDKLSRKDFDHVLWYCYKGNEKERQNLVIDAIKAL